LKEEAQDRTLWRTQFGTGYGPVARQTTTWHIQSSRVNGEICNSSDWIEGRLTEVRRNGVREQWPLMGHVFRILDDILLLFMLWESSCLVSFAVQGECTKNIFLYIAHHSAGTLSWHLIALKVKLSLCFTNEAPHHECVWGSGCIDQHFPDFDTNWSWVVSFTTRLLYTRDPLGRRLDGP
jgi:hypothetical protein